MNPELKKLTDSQGHPNSPSRWEGNMENECPRGLLFDRMTWLRGWGPTCGWGVTRPGRLECTGSPIRLNGQQESESDLCAETRDDREEGTLSEPCLATWLWPQRCCGAVSHGAEDGAARIYNGQTQLCHLPSPGAFWWPQLDFSLSLS